MVRRHQKPIDLLVARVLEPDHHPVACFGVGGANLDALDHAIEPRRGGDLEVAPLVEVHLGKRAQVDHGDVVADRHRVDRVGSAGERQHGQEGSEEAGHVSSSRANGNGSGVSPLTSPKRTWSRQAPSMQRKRRA